MALFRRYRHGLALKRPDEQRLLRFAAVEPSPGFQVRSGPHPGLVPPFLRLASSPTPWLARWPLAPSARPRLRALPLLYAARAALGARLAAGHPAYRACQRDQSTSRWTRHARFPILGRAGPARAACRDRVQWRCGGRWRRRIPRRPGSGLVHRDRRCRGRRGTKRLQSAAGLASHAGQGQWLRPVQRDCRSRQGCLCLLPPARERRVQRTPGSA